jgi:hypothetical protein
LRVVIKAVLAHGKGDAVTGLARVRAGADSVMELPADTF